ncbi:MAG: CocE/NonD family hydrolase [Acidobacteriota bacterium]
MKHKLLASTICAILCAFSAGMLQPAMARTLSEEVLRLQYEKREFRIPMRDQVHLFTAVYIPRDRSRRYPILLKRTPYSVQPYGSNEYPEQLGPSPLFDREGYIFVLQDVRGCFMSEGEFVNMRPLLPPGHARTEVDESTDTYDTIQWLLEHVAGHNGKVGMWGISYPGFYAAAGMVNAHPALAAVSPQAPIADWFFDDFHHHGAFFLAHAFNFLINFGLPRPSPTSRHHRRFDHGTPDGYQFFMDAGTMRQLEDRYMHGQVAYWKELAQHPNYDEYWQARNLLPRLDRVAPAVLTVGGWFDAEDLYGSLKIYRSIEARNPGIVNTLVMGPWFHGAWARDDGEQLGNVFFGSKTSDFFRSEIELPFFRHFLKGIPEPDLPEAWVFETGANRWRRFDTWPPKSVEARSLYLEPGRALGWEPPTEVGAVFDEYVSDPGHPVPFTQSIAIGMTREYMTDDQRFAARRPDVLSYETGILDEDVTLAGPLLADLWVSTSGTASDWVVKLIDVFPPDAEDYPMMTDGEKLGGYQMMVRSEAIRGRFRRSNSRPEPFLPDQPTRVSLELLDLLHTFRKGHRIMVQIQSTWFPLVDLNPQRYVDNIFEARETDFVVARQRVLHSRQYPSHLVVGILPAQDQVRLPQHGPSQAREAADQDPGTRN